MSFFRSYMKAMVWAIIVSFMVGTMLSYFGNDERLDMLIEVRNEVNGGYVEKPVIFTFPKSNIAYSEKVAGKGRNVINMETSWFLFARVKAKGYKPGWKIVQVEPDKRIRIYLEKEEQPKAQKDVKPIEKIKVQQPEAPVDVQGFWDKLKDSI